MITQPNIEDDKMLIADRTFEADDTVTFVSSDAYERCNFFDCTIQSVGDRSVLTLMSFVDCHFTDKASEWIKDWTGFTIL